MKKIFPGLVAALLLAATGFASEKQNPYTFTFFTENDFYYGGSDRHYTNGIQLSLISPALQSFDEAEGYSGVDIIPSWIGRHVESMPWMTGPEKSSHVGLSLAQYIFTPEDISMPDPSLGDRPYAGWLNTGFSYHAKEAFPDRNLAILDSFEVNLGIVGPASLAEQAQKTWHSIIDAAEPMGWDFQLKNEPTLNLFWQRKWAIRQPLTETIDLEWIPQGGAALGNVHIYGNAGLEVRAGYNLPSDFGSSQMRGAASPPLPDGSIHSDAEPWGFHLFAGIEGRAVGRNLFLDGNTFRDSRSVDRENYMATAKAGFGLRFDTVQVSFSMIWRSKEFKGQQESARYGSIHITFPLFL